MSFRSVATLPGHCQVGYRIAEKPNLKPYFNDVCSFLVVPSIRFPTEILHYFHFLFAISPSNILTYFS